LHPQEFKQSIQGYSKGMKQSKTMSFLRNLDSTEYTAPTQEEKAALPTNVDWRILGISTPVKD